MSASGIHTTGFPAWYHSSAVSGANIPAASPEHHPMDGEPQHREREELLDHLGQARLVRASGGAGETRRGGSDQTSPEQAWGRARAPA